MRKLFWLSTFCLWPVAAFAAEYSSVYTPFDLDKTCKLVEKGDEYTYAGTWRCPGYKGADIFIASADDREFAGFGKAGNQSCAFQKTFTAFNSALSPVEWRMKNGKPLATIQRWRVVVDENGNTATWLVVSAIKGKEACHISYVAGSYPDANTVARAMADGEAESFDCERDVPTVNSKAGPPDINMSSCSELARE